MSKVFIDFVKYNKDELVKLVEPNFIYNRMDFRFDDNYELIKITTENNETKYVTIHVNGDTLYLGCYLVDISENAFNKLIEFLFMLYKNVEFIKIKFSKNDYKYKSLSKTKCWQLQLPDTIDEYIESLGYKTRRDIRNRDKKLHNEFDFKIETYEKDIPSHIVEAYFDLKKQRLGKEYKTTPQNYLQEFYVTKAVVIYLNNKIASVAFFSALPDDSSKNLYYENFAFDLAYSKYLLGTMTCFYSIKILIEQGYKVIQFGGGDYLYKQQLCNIQSECYNGTIKRILKKHFWQNAFAFYQDKTFYYLRLFGLKIKKRKAIETCLLEINQDTKCLMVCPHPDDEILGAGALMIKYSDNFDCICMGSSGVATTEMSAEDRSKVRIKEFHEVMETIGVKKHWIFETFGVPRFDRQMDKHFDEYCETLKNLKDYDYIFLPHPQDGHHEHRYITNNLFKKIAKKVGVNPNTKIVFYEVWNDIKNPNVFFDASKDGFLYAKKGFKKYQKAYSKLLGTTDETLLELKYRILNMYKSQFTKINIFAVQTTRTKCINNGKNPIWRYKVVDMKKYM